MAIGSETVPIRSASKMSLALGTAVPNPTPTAIASKIHNGRKRSSTDKRPTMPDGCVDSILLDCDINGWTSSGDCTWFSESRSKAAADIASQRTENTHQGDVNDRLLSLHNLSYDKYALDREPGSNLKVHAAPSLIRCRPTERSAMVLLKLVLDV